MTGRLPRSMLLTVAWATLLNPLNSSMIAVALVPIQAAFRVGVQDATWLISGFYLAGAVGQPLMGRLADEFGPRRIFVGGLALAGLTGAAAPFAPSIGWLVGLRVLQALGTAGAFPAGMAIFRSRSGGPRPPAGALAVVSVGANVSAAVGPTLGGGLVQFAGWPAIFLLNLPAAVLGIVLGLRFLPPDPGRPPASPRAVVGLIDLPGVALFTASVGGLLAFLLSLSSGPRWPLLPLAPVAAALLVWHELRARAPFLDVRMLAPARGLAAVYGQFTALNFVFYSIFFSLPLWLEKVRGAAPGQAGLILTPLAGLGVLATVVAARLIGRWGPGLPVALGAAVLCVGVLLLLALSPATPLAVVLAIVAVLGLPNGLLTLGLQAVMFSAAGSDEMGAASGLFQTCRYVGSVLSTSLLGLVFDRGVTSAGLHAMAIALTAISALLLASTLPRLLRPEAQATA
ncbi:MAG TPA: MFS transporter [Candidatus Dormibacteraeota bacterium]|nr:MFS transporter [Candidatus Dormibacteraeota bacterium]